MAFSGAQATLHGEIDRSHEKAFVVPERMAQAIQQRMASADVQHLDFQKLHLRNFFRVGHKTSLHYIPHFELNIFEGQSFTCIGAKMQLVEMGPKIQIQMIRHYFESRSFYISAR